MEELEPKDWLRCNRCFIIMSHSQVPFYFLFCGHIFCSNCVQKIEKQCLQCGVQIIEMQILMEPLNPKMKHCFESMEKLLEKLQQASLFQNMQLSLNFNRFYAVETKYTLMKEEYKRKCEANRVLQKRLQELEAEMESSQRKIYEIQNSKAMMTQCSRTSASKEMANCIRTLCQMRNEDHTKNPSSSLFSSASSNFSEESTIPNTQKNFRSHR